MQFTSVSTWLRDRRIIAFVVVLALVLTISIGLVISGPATIGAADDLPESAEVVNEELVIAGPSWTWNGPIVGDPGIPPVWFFGPSWG